jgi:hypothetical protein
MGFKMYSIHLRQRMARGEGLDLTVALAVVLVGLGGLVRGSAGDQLVGERSLMIAGDTAVVVLIVRVGLSGVV